MNPLLKLCAGTKERNGKLRGRDEGWANRDGFRSVPI